MIGGGGDADADSNDVDEYNDGSVGYHDYIDNDDDDYGNDNIDHDCI